MGIEPTTIPGDLAAGESVNHSATRGGRSFGRGTRQNAELGYLGLKFLASDRFRLADQNETKNGRKILKNPFFF